MLKSRKLRIVKLAVTAVVGMLFVGAVCTASFGLRALWPADPKTYRFPFPATQSLSEEDAIALTREALILDGKGTPGMRAVLSGHHDSTGREMVFLRHPKGSDNGHVLWWLERPGYTWENGVGISRDGDEVVCTIGNKPK